jgi:two-component system nitrogen regulation response regulator GlnG
VGGTTSLKTDIRLTFTTTHDPAELLRSGRLREDLFYALSAYELYIPPLRERGDDLRLLTERFVARFGSFGRSLVGSLPRVSPKAYQLLSAYDWPGNVCELQAVLRRALIDSKGAVLASDFLKQLVSSRSAKPAPTFESATASRPAASEVEKHGAPPSTDWRRFVEGRLNAGSETVYDEAIEEMERHVVSIVLTHTGGNQAKAAKLLGMTRTSLRKKVLALGIRLGPYLASSGENE